MIIVSSIIAVLMAVAVMVVRIKSSDKPVSPKNHSSADFYEYGSVNVFISGILGNWSRVFGSIHFRCDFLYFSNQNF